MNLLQLLELTFLQGGFTTRSDTARLNAEAVAEGACRGFLTTETPFGGFQSVWRLTPSGQMYLWNNAAEIVEQAYEELAAWQHLVS